MTLREDRRFKPRDKFEKEISRKIIVSDEKQSKITGDYMRRAFDSSSKDEKMQIIKMLHIASRIAIRNSKEKIYSKRKRKEFLDISYLYRTLISDFSKRYKEKYGVRPDLRSDKL